MHKCPNCGRIIFTDMVYSHGTPRVYYHCTCGWDSRNQKVTWSNNTNKLERK